MDDDIITGMSWSLETTTWALRQLYRCIPTTLMVESIRSVCLRGWDITHPVVLDGFMATIGWILVSLIVLFVVKGRRYMQVNSED